MRQTTRTPRRRLVDVVLAAAVAFLVLGAPLGGGALAHDGEGSSIDIEPSSARPGVVMRVLGEDFPAATAVELLVRQANGDVLVGTATSDEQGHFATEFTLAGSFAPRAYEIRAQTSVSPPATALITVLAPPEPGRLRWVAPLAAVVVAVLAGGAAVALWRVRRPNTT